MYKGTKYVDSTPLTVCAVAYAKSAVKNMVNTSKLVGLTRAERCVPVNYFLVTGDCICVLSAEGRSLSSTFNCDYAL